MGWGKREEKAVGGKESKEEGKEEAKAASAGMFVCGEGKRS